MVAPKIDTMIAESAAAKTLYITISGDPIAQERPRFRCLWNQRKIVVYDPNKADKDRLRRALKISLQKIGEQEFPIFGVGQVNLGLFFGVETNNKDFDNMSKFIADVLSKKLVLGDDIQIKTGSFKIEQVPDGFTRVELSQAH